MKSVLLKVTLSIPLFLYATLLFAAQVVASVDAPIDKFNASVGLGVENSNNISLAAYNQKSDNILHETLSASYTRNSRTVRALFSLNADHQRYQNHSFPDQNVFSSLLDLNAILIKNRFTWDISNRFDRVPTSSAVLNIPTNQENTNTFTTGPTYVVFRNARQYLNLSLKYNKFYTQKSDIDSSSYSGNAVYNRDLTRTFAVKLNVDSSKRYFVNTTLNTDYHRTDGVISFIKRFKLSSLTIASGETRISRAGEANIEHGIFKLDYNYNIEDMASLKIGYDRELGDFTGIFSSASASQVGGTFPTVGSQIFLMENGNILINRNFGKSNVGLNFSYFSAQYTDETLNVTRKASELSYDAKITSSLDMKLTGAYAINTFNASNRRDTAAIYTGMLRRKIAGSYLISLKLQFTQRNSNLAAFSGNERRVALNGQYFFN